MSIYKPSEEKEKVVEAAAQRTDIAHYMDVTGMAGVTGDDTVWTLMGAGWTSNTESPSAQTKERKFINEKSARKNITSYSPSFSFEVLLMFNKPEIRKIYDIYTKRKTGNDAVITMVTVDLFDEAKSGKYPARKGRYAVEVSSCDDDDDMIIKGNLNGQGDEDIGWFNPETGVWSDEDPVSSYSSSDPTKVGTVPETAGTSKASTKSSE